MVDIVILQATTYDNLSVIDYIIGTVTLPIWECSGLLGPSMEVTTWENPAEIYTIHPRSG